MAQITITGVIEDAQNAKPSSGTVNFTLSDWYIDAGGDFTLPKSESCSINPADGTFSIVLESTEDGTPNGRTYNVSVNCTIGGVALQQSLGAFTLPPSPSPRLLRDLLIIGSAPLSLLRLVDDETPSGSIDNSNLTFTLASTPLAGTVKIYLSGVRQLIGVDYTMSGATITFTIPPQTGHTIRCDYRTSS
jgi:hypothetical protein